MSESDTALLIVNTGDRFDLTEATKGYNTLLQNIYRRPARHYLYLNR